MDHQSTALLKLLHLADSALPIGSAAHSFGIESLVFEGELAVEELEAFFTHYVAEVGRLEASYCRQGYAVGAAMAATPVDDAGPDWTQWLMLNRRLSARKMARESREAGATLGRRLLRLVLSLDYDDRLHEALSVAGDSDLHHTTVFGLLGGYWRLGADETVSAYLQQMLTGLVSACQRLMPLGQNRAQSIIWSLQPQLLTAMQLSSVADADGNTTIVDLDPPSFACLLEAGSMRHPALPVRLFIS